MTSLHEARIRRAALNPFFSKTAVRKLEPLLHRNLSRFFTRMNSFVDSKLPITLSRAYRCLTADIITEYSYAKSFGGLDREDFHPDFLRGFEEFARAVWLPTYFPVTFNAIERVCAMLPKRVVKAMMPGLYYIQNLQDVCIRPL